MADVAEKLKNFTCGELAERCGVSKACISLVTRGMRNPRLSLLRSMAAALEVSTGDLEAYLGERAPNRPSVGQTA
jgi:transcriptional regulator with XRE-family HTH domain